jgi:hypothetical protein
MAALSWDDAFFVEPKLEMTQALSAPQELHKIFQQMNESIEHVIIYLSMQNKLELKLVRGET